MRTSLASEKFFDKYDFEIAYNEGAYELRLSEGEKVLALVESRNPWTTGILNATCRDLSDMSVFNNPQEAKRLLMPVFARAKEQSKAVVLLEERTMNKIEDLTLASESHFKRIHPAVDFVDDKLHYGFFLPVRKGENEKERFVLLTNLKGLVHGDHLEAEGIKLTQQPICKASRWNIKDVKAYMDRKSEDVMPDELFVELRRIYRKYIEFPNEGDYTFLPLWVMGTYLFPMFETYPYIYVGGVKGSGKSKVLKLTSCMAFNGIWSVGMSLSAVFRMVQSDRASLFIDESELLNNPKRSEDIQLILNSGYEKGATVQRVEREGKEDQLKVNYYETYSPKAIGNIRGISDATATRCIGINMLRTDKSEVGSAEVRLNDKLWFELRNRLYLWGLAWWPLAKKAYDTLDNAYGIDNRDWQLWKPILALAKSIDDFTFKFCKKGTDTVINEEFNTTCAACVPPETIPRGPLLLKVLEYARQKIAEKAGDDLLDTTELLLIESLSGIVKESKYYTISEIRQALSEKYEDDVKWITNSFVGRLLNKLGFTIKRRIGRGKEYLLSVKEIEDRSKRYIKSSSVPGSISDSAQETQVVNGSSGELTVKGEIVEVNRNSGSVGEQIRQSQSSLSSPSNVIIFNMANNSTLISSTKTKSESDFIAIDKHQGRCAYCGEERERSWKDKEGNYLCWECHDAEVLIGGEINP